MKQAVKSLYVEIKREEYEGLRARVAEQAREIGRHAAVIRAFENGYAYQRLESELAELKSQQSAGVDERAAIQTTPFISSTGETRNPIYEGQFDDESPEQATARLHWARVAIEMARAAQHDHSAQILNMVQKPYACEYGQDNGDGTYSVTIKRMPLPSYMQPVKDWPVKMLYTAKQPALDVSGLVDALQPFADFIEGTDPVWSDDRRISTLDYDFTKLRLGLFRKARTALTAHRAKA